MDVPTFFTTKANLGSVLQLQRYAGIATYTMRREKLLSLFFLQQFDREILKRDDYHRLGQRWEELVWKMICASHTGRFQLA